MKKGFMRVFSGLMACTLLLAGLPATLVAAGTESVAVAADASELKIVTQPKSVAVAEGAKAAVKVVASGTDLTYKWYFKDAGASKYSLTTSFTGTSYSVTMNDARNGRQVYCVITDKYGNKVQTNTVMLSMEASGVTITTQPQSVTVAKGATAAVKVAASGSGLTYKWYFKDSDASKFSLTTSFTSNTYSVTMTDARNGRQVYCVITDKDGNKVQTNTVMLSMEASGVTITTQPQSVTVAKGATAAVKVAASGSGLTYKWYFKDAGTSKFSLTTSFTSNTYSVTMTDARNGRQVYCVITDKYGNKVQSDTATLNMKITGPKITTQPQSVVVTKGATAAVKVVASGSGLTYKWYFKDSDASKFSLTTSFTSNTYSVAMNASRSGRQVYCVITDKYGNSVKTDVATLKMSIPLKITTQPKSVTVANGAKAQVKVAVNGTGLTYKWYFKEPGATDFSLTTSFTGTSYSVTMNNNRDGRQVYCVITDEYGDSVTTNTVTLALKKELKILKQPQTMMVEQDAYGRVIVEAQGNNLTYLWQYSDNFGDTWKDSTITERAYAIKVSKDLHGRMVRCRITDSNGKTVTSEPASLLVEALLKATITKQPQNVICAVNDTVSLTTTAVGIDPQYQWQYSTDGTNWVDLDITTPTYTLTATASAMKRSYRCLVWDDYSNVCASDVVRLLNEKQLIQVQPENWIGCENGKVFFNTVLLDSVTSCQWQYSNDNGVTWNDTSINGSYYSTTAIPKKTKWLYRCVAIDNNGNTQISNTVSFSLSDQFAIIEQPTDLSANMDESVIFFIQASGTDVTFNWQKSTDGKTWSSVKNTARVSQTVRYTTTGQYYRCVVTNGDGRTLTSDVVQMKWNNTGFYLYEDRIYYVKNDGRLATGFEVLDDGVHYFTEKGIMRTGYRELDSGIYYFDTKGVAAKGFTYVPYVDSVLYFGEDGAAAIGWTKIDGNTYYFYENGAIALGITQIGNDEYFFDQKTGIQTFGMVEVGVNTYMYFQKEAKQPYTGLKSFGKNLYYFAEQGKNRGVTQGSMQTTGENTYYFDPVTKQAVSGWVVHNNNTYFFGEDYALVKNGRVYQDNKLYFTNARGTLRYGLYTLNDKRYYLDPTTGAAISGWVELDGSLLYFDPITYEAKTGVATIDGVKYYFSAVGYLRTGIREVNDVRYLFTKPGEKKTGFVEINEKVYYVYDDQSLAIGLVTINKKLYYFDSAGIMRTGMRKIDNDRYYFDPETGAAATILLQMSNSYTYYFDAVAGTTSGLKKINGDLYCLNSSGILRYGRIEVGGKLYYFDPQTGKALTGWQSILISDGTANLAYFDPDTYTAVTGLQKIDGNLYYFDDNGWAKATKRKVGDVTYYFSPGTYEAYTGWFKNSDGSYTYYDGANGQILKAGLVTIDGATYYFDSKGRRQTGMKTLDGVKVYFDPVTAQPVTGFVFIEDETAANGGKTYYFDGLKGARYGLQTIGGNQYHFNTKSAIMEYGMKTVNGVKCFFDEKTGVRKYGLIYASATGSWYLFDRTGATGVATTTATIGGVLYVSRSSGIPRSGYCAASTSGLKYNVYLDTKTFEQQLGLISYANSSGKTITAYFKKDSSTTSITAIRTALDKALTTSGWHTVEGLKYYVKNGAFYKGKKTISSKTYYFSEMSGAMLTGLRQIGDKRYYFDPSTGVMQTGFVTIDGQKCYFDPETGAQVLGLKKVGSNYYYFTESGVLTGTVPIGKNQYKFPSSGAGKKLSTSKTPAPVQAEPAASWGTYDEAKCFFDLYGQRVTGLRTIDGKLYYFDADGKMKTGLLQVGDATYYFKDSGAVNGKVKISGKEYYFSPSNLQMLTGMYEIDDVFYYYQENGTRKNGWITTASGHRLYMTTSGALTGLNEIDGKTYFFGEDCVMKTGAQQVTAADGTQITCLFDDDGTMVTGFVTNSLGMYYYDPATGARVTGFVTVDGKEYYFDPDTGIAKTGLCNIEGVYCYFDSKTGVRKYGLQTVSGNLYCYTKGMTEPGFATGITMVDGKTYCFSEASGAAFTGYYMADDVAYYFDPKTGASVSGIYRRDDGTAFSFKAGGGVNTGWVTENGQSYFFYPATGMMAEGLASVGDYLYYFELGKGFLRNTTITVGGVVYELDENGHGRAQGDSNLAKLINAGIDSFPRGYGSEDDPENPDNFTCSQLVAHVYESFGIELSRRSCRQYYALANGVYDCNIIEDINQAKAGDLIFFITTNCSNPTSCTCWNEIHHVGVYLGEGKILGSYAIEGDDYNDGPMIRNVEPLHSSFIYKLIRIKGVND